MNTKNPEECDSISYDNKVDKWSLGVVVLQHTDGLLMIPKTEISVITK